ncbi:hypothetical protein [Brevibacterium sp. UCMA 11754]|uniref:hypothetical protein n=1 Tax=Brevibacterium sp. UCMA 11754 TaxID=2749198 RepID=UPI001F1E6F9B|nr:hypothetical protein [Brevibacterium sp. UCMA 11754]MCF2571613.1 hypothetical protein [Brevibacterium sp. UCMA 11754]
MDLLRFIADHDGRTLNEDDLDAWVYPVDEIPIILADDWRAAISKHYAGEGAAHARPGDILAETKRIRDRRTGTRRPQLESNPQRVPCPPELR